MTDAHAIEDQLSIGRPLLISATTSDGRMIQFGAEISSLGGHHFKVRTNRPIPPTLLASQQIVKIRLQGKGQSTLPLSCRFLRIDEQKARELVLSFPEGNWVTNRRAFVRAPIKVKVVITRHSGQRLEGETIDVSGGGVLTTLNGALNPRETVLLKLGPLPDTQEVLEFDARLVRAVQMNVNRRNNSEPFTAYAMKFVKVAARAQNRICKMVIVNQFEERRAELRDILGKEK
ncbi:MAG: PilZ domain-containing protein [Deltaproteobacteria bacterium]|nr:PilZ domain-containing protein [Deltaproteobacteria bacterium]